MIDFDEITRNFAKDLCRRNSVTTKEITRFFDTNQTAKTSTTFIQPGIHLTESDNSHIHNPTKLLDFLSKHHPREQDQVAMIAAPIISMNFAECRSCGGDLSK